MIGGIVKGYNLPIDYVLYEMSYTNMIMYGAVIGGIVKGYNLPIDYVLYEMSYTNMIMYGAVIPSYSGKQAKKKDEGQDIINADDPRNRERIRKIFEMT